MATSIRASSSATAAASSVSCAMPTGTVQNDVMYAACANDNGVNTTSAPTGWSHVGGATDSVGGGLDVYRKVAGSGEAGPYSFSGFGSSGGAVVIVSVAGANTTTPEDVTANSSGSATVSPVAPSVTPTGAADMLLCFFGCDHNHNSNRSMTSAPTGMTIEVQADLTTQFDMAAICYEQLSASGATGTKTATINASSSYATCTIAVSPSAGGGTTTDLSVSGATGTVSGALARLSQKVLAGASGAVSGGLARSANKVLAGATGAVSGVVAAALVQVVTLAGAAGALSGTLVRLPQKALSGATGAVSGLLARLPQKVLSGATGTVSGALSSVVVKVLALAGATGALSGALARVATKTVAGATGAVSGGLARSANKVLAGATGAVSGAFAVSHALIVMLTGALGLTVTETIVPTGAGFYTEWGELFGSFGTHWQAAATNDGNTSYVFDNTWLGTERDSYTASDLVNPYTSIDSVTVHVVAARKTAVTDANNLKVFLRSGSTDDESAAQDLTGSDESTNTFLDVSHTWTTDPATGLPWTIAGVNALEIGARDAMGTGSTGGVSFTQVYAVITGKDGGLSGIVSRLSMKTLIGAVASVSGAVARFTQHALRGSLGPDLNLSGNEITDSVRAASVQGDGRAPESSVGIWKATTNLLTNGGFETNTTGHIAQGASTFARVVGDAKFGAAYLHMLWDGVSGQYYDLQSVVPISGATAGRQFTFSVWVRGTGAAVGQPFHFEMEEDGGASGNSNNVFHVGVLTSDWVRYSATLTVVQNDRTGIKVRAPRRGSAGTDSALIAGEGMDADGMQLEESPYPTPYVQTDGAAATRAVAAVTAPVAGVLSTAQGWVAVRLRNGANASNAPSINESPTLFGWRSASNSDYLTLFLRATSIDWRVRFHSGGVSQDINSAVQTFLAGQKQTVIGAWTTSNLYVSVDGSTLGAGTSRTLLPSGLQDFFNVGGFTSSAEPLSGDILWFACGSGTLSDTDVATLNAFGDTDPTFAALPGNPTMLWSANSASAVSGLVTKRTSIPLTGASGAVSGAVTTTKLILQFVLSRAVAGVAKARTAVAGVVRRQRRS